jgi:hypothetical protein
MTYRTEFPDFDYDLPSLEGFFDQSWHNDTCPKLVREDGDVTVTVWCDYADAGMREGWGPRYAVTVAYPEEEPIEISATDDWESVLAVLRAGCWLD